MTLKENRMNFIMKYGLLKLSVSFLFIGIYSVCCYVVMAQEWDYNWVVPVHSIAFETGLDVAADPNSEFVYLVGEFDKDLDTIWGDLTRPSTDFSYGYGGNDGFVAKYDSSGNYQWAFKVGSTKDDEVRSVTVDADGNIYITGFVDDGICQFTGTSSLTPDSSFTNVTHKDFFLAKYNSNGALLWVRNCNGSADDVHGMDVIATSSGIYAAGHYKGILNFGSRFIPDYEAKEDLFVVKYTTDGNLVWMLSGGGDDVDMAKDLTSDGNDLYLIGQYNSDSINFRDTTGTVVSTQVNPNAGDDAIFVFNINSDSDFGWSVQITSSDGNNEGNGICMDSNSLYITGAICDLSTFPSYASNPVNVSFKKDIFLASISKDNGSTGWVRIMYCDDNGDEISYSIAIDLWGSLYITGLYRGILDIHGDTIITSIGNEDIFVASYSSAGSLQWAKTAGSSGGKDIGYGISTDGIANIYYTGTYDHEAYFNTYTLPDDIGENIFLADIQMACEDAIGGTALAASDHICLNDIATINLTAYTGMIQWQYSPLGAGTWTDIAGANNPTLNQVPTDTTDYRAYVSSGSCSPDSSNVVTIYIYNLPTLTLPAALALCAGDSTDIQLDFNVPSPWDIGYTTGGDTTYLSDITDNPYLLRVSPPADTVYDFVFLEDGNNCVSANVGSVPITVYGQPVANAGPGGDECDLDHDLQATPSVGTGTWTQSAGPGTASFAPDAGTPDATVTVDLFGTYQFTWTETNGTCSDDSTITVNFYEQPIANAGNDTIILQGSTITLQGSGGVNYEWSPIQGLSNASISNPEASPLTTTTYTLTVTSINRCSDTNEVIITVREPGFANAGQDQALCIGDSVRLEASGGIGYSWSPTEGISNAEINNPKASPIKTTVYTVEVTNADELVDRDEMTITVYPKPVITVVENISVCEGDSTELNASGGVNYQWIPDTYLNDPFDARPISSPLSDIDYKLIVTDENQCRDSVTVSLHVDIRPTVYAGEDMEMNFKFDTSMRAMIPEAGVGEWSLLSGTGEFIDRKDPGTGVTGLTVGENIFQWGVKNGVCPLITDEMTILVNNLLIPNMITPNFDNRNDKFVIPGLENAGDVQVIIFNRWGNEIFSSDHYQNDWQGQDKNGEDLPADTYFYVLSFKNGETMRGYVIIKR